ncbi:hypothetical protein DS830_05990 [Bombilactobacillus bombi]|uniref:hypothetical protein n=1 Tax=Bombilactobacillus bombi TaxID=1303590 RepID=UPI000E57F0AA|nr:hypothetical protein [Bombilactobacillus bombi]AXX65050.1 hypothetical protein DS830_05990 [Bombilactobacillus bombi]
MYNQSIITPESINAIIVGTSTDPDLFKSNANQIMSFLTNSHDYIGFDVQSSESSEVNAVLSALSLVKSNFVDNCLAIGADSLSRHIFSSELRESYIGNGEAAMLIGNKI